MSHSSGSAPHIVIVGAGAVGGYVGGHLSRSGHRVTFVDPWPEHVDAIRRDGVRLSGTQGDYQVKIEAMHVSDVQSLTRSPVDIAIIATKCFDTLWAARMIRDYLAPGGYVVSMQNSINEPRIASVVGWERTVGCVLSTIGVSTAGPGHLTRFRTPGGGGHAVFRVGEVHGRVTPRAHGLAALLGSVDKAGVTTNLWGERWAKLVTNAMQMGLLGATGLCNEEVIGDAATRNIVVRAAAEGIQVARAQGYDLAPIVSVAGDVWIAAAGGDPAATQQVDEALFAYLDRQSPAGRRGHGSLGRDLLAGRRCEIDFVNGFIADCGDAGGVPTPVHRALTTIIKRIERGDLKPARSNIQALLQ